ncbi:exonuclease [Cystoisospora suis]|uniref:Exonuclease n=1 Tax=Cystoisospora suis TaxID=483139 RepID=A0A2C6KKK3_9APIC|nr:exonuclease [Cystoisospora suis]
MPGLSDQDADAASSLPTDRQASLSQQDGTSHRDRPRGRGCSPLCALLSSSPTTSVCKSLTESAPAVVGRLSEQHLLALAASTTEKDGESERTEVYEHKADESNVCARAHIFCKEWERDEECLQKERDQHRCQAKNSERSQLPPSSDGSHPHYGQSSQHLERHEKEQEPVIQNDMCAHHGDLCKGTESRSPAAERGQPSVEPDAPVVTIDRGTRPSKEAASHTRSPSSSDPTPNNGDGQEELPWVPRSGDLVELRPCEGGRDCPLLWKGEVICVYEDSGRGPLVDLLRFTKKGVAYRNPYAGLLKAVDVNSLRLVQRAEDRFESTRGRTDNFSGGVVGFSLHPPKFTAGVDPDLGALCFFWDLETTGLDTATDEITEIGCVARLFRDGRWQDVTGPKESEGFAVYVHTNRDIPPEVQALTRITKQLLREEGTSTAGWFFLTAGLGGVPDF